MKIKSTIDTKKISFEARYNPNTRGTHLFIEDGKPNEEKKDYANIALVSLMYERGFLKGSFEETEASAREVVESHENRGSRGL